MELKLESHFLVKEVDGFTPAIGHLVCMMDYARHTTAVEVQGLATEELDFLFDERANSIGMLLEHMACVEIGYQANTFGWRLEGEAFERWELGSDLGDEGRRLIRGNDLDHYLRQLEDVRTRTLEEFARRDDAWLFEECEWWGGRPGNNYFKWFHVFEDEINHRGQIRFLRKRLPK